MALLVVAIVGAAWLAAGTQPTLAGAVVSAAWGAISGFALALAASEAVACEGCAGVPQGVLVRGRVSG